MKKYEMLVTKKMYRERKKEDIGKWKSKSKSKEERANQTAFTLFL